MFLYQGGSDGNGHVSNGRIAGVCRLYAEGVFAGRKVGIAGITIAIGAYPVLIDTGKPVIIPRPPDIQESEVRKFDGDEILACRVRGTGLRASNTESVNTGWSNSLNPVIAMVGFSLLWDRLSG